jgi:hypothetical protein
VVQLAEQNIAIGRIGPLDVRAARRLEVEGDVVVPSPAYVDEASMKLAAA